MKKVIFMAESYKHYKPIIDAFIEGETQLSLLSECSRPLLQTLLKEEIDLFIYYRSIR